MTQAAEKILSDAMRLSDAERADLAGKLLDSLEPHGEELSEADHAAAWEAEIARRIEELDSGKVNAIPREEAMKMIGRKWTNETT